MNAKVRIVGTFLFFFIPTFFLMNPPAGKVRTLLFCFSDPSIPLRRNQKDQGQTNGSASRDGGIRPAPHAGVVCRRVILVLGSLKRRINQ